MTRPGLVRLPAVLPSSPRLELIRLRVPLRAHAVSRVQRAVLGILARRVDVLVEVVFGNGSWRCQLAHVRFPHQFLAYGLTLGRLGQTAELSRLHDTPRDQSRPSTLVRSAQSTSIVTVEELPSASALRSTWASRLTS